MKSPSSLNQLINHTQIKILHNKIMSDTEIYKKDAINLWFNIKTEICGLKVTLILIMDVFIKI